ncbi:hypothetical protein AB0F81_24325 [Actinoplanes sp. NPDC024001]|uniref:hypothetical protein n=1 Tax=Actinoplanes sp. NPDC024001 TaxID=3154598 RepID=UPI0033D7002E
MSRRARARRSRTRTFWFVAGCLAAAGSVLVLALGLRMGGLQDAANIAQLVSVGIALPPALALLYTWWRDGRVRSVVTPTGLADARDLLALHLDMQWLDESRLRALDDSIPVHWRVSAHEELVDVPRDRAATELTIASAADVDKLIGTVRELGRRRLVILGGGGTGKTTMAARILQQLLRERRHRPDEPVPVLLPLAGWPGDAYDGDLRDWIVDWITNAYPGLGSAGHDADVVEALVVRGHVLPILDGLDETTAEVRDAFIPAVHRDLGTASRFVLTCRTDEFGETVGRGGRALTSVVVMRPEPLTATASAEYLRGCLEAGPAQKWQAILGRLEGPVPPTGAAAALATVVSKPLGLWLIRAAYIAPGTDPSPLDDARFADPAELTAHLFDQLVAASIEARPPANDPPQPFRPRRRYDPGQAEDWLTFLAYNLNRRGSREFYWATDTAGLTLAPRFTEPVAGFLDRAAPVVAKMIDRYNGWSLRIQFLVLIVLPGILIGSLITLAISSLPGLLLVLLLVAAGVLAARTFALYEKESERGAADWQSVLDQQWYRTRQLFERVAPGVLFMLGYAVMTGGLTAVVTELLLRNGAGPRAGLAVAAVVAVLAGAEYWFYWRLPPGSERKGKRWYGIAPGSGIRSGVFIGFVMGAIGAGGLTVALDSTGLTDSITALWFILAITVPFSCVLYVLVRAIAVPVCFTLTAGIPLLLARPAASGRDDSLTLWDSEQRKQVLRACRLAAVTVLLAVAAGVVCRILRDRPEVAALHRDGVVAGVTAHLAQVDLTWHGQLRYVFAVVLAWLVTMARRRAYRTLLNWLVWFAVAGVVVWVWPGQPAGDYFRLHLGVRGGEFTFDATARLAGGVADVRAQQSVDLGAALTNTPVRVMFFIWLFMLAVVAADAFFARIEEFHSRAWWVGWLTSRMQAARGRLPRDLVVFLDDAHRLGLLRAVGPVYQFRHADFQDHLARRFTAPTEQAYHRRP